MTRSIATLLLILTPSAALADGSARTVKVTGTAVARVLPDTIVWHVSIRHTNSDLIQAREACDQSMQQLLSLRGQLGIEAADAQTGYLNIDKVYQRDRSGNRGEFRHYAVYRSLTLKQRNTKRFDDVLQRLTAAADVEVSYSLESSDFHEVRLATRLRAVTAAKEKAAAMTELLGARLGAVLAIDESRDGAQRSYMSPMSNAAFVSGPEAQPDDIAGTFAPGAIQVQVSVDVKFAIE